MQTPPLQPESRRERLDALQALRAIAALLVVCDHALTNMILNAGATAAPQFGWFLGGLGVYVFFAISGFVMIYAHGRDFGVPGATGRFYLRRIGRIVPLYWTVTILYALKLAQEGRGGGIGDTLLSLFFIPYQGADEYGHPVLGQGWTLNYEMIFYLVFGLALTMRNGIWLIFAVFGALTALGLTGVFGEGNPLAFWARPVVLYFLAGVAIGLVRRRLPPRGPDFPRALTLASAAIGIAILTAALAGPTSAAAVVATAFAAIAGVGACAIARESAGGSRLRTLARQLGDASYSIYLTHTFVLGPASKLVGAWLPGMPVWLFIALMLPVSALAGMIVYRLVERPLTRGWALLFSPQPVPARSA